MKRKLSFSELNEVWRDADPISQNLDALNRRAFVVKGEDRLEPWNVKAFVRAYAAPVEAILHVRYAVVEREKERRLAKNRKFFGLRKGRVEPETLRPLEETGRALDELAREVFDEGFDAQRRERFLAIVDRGIPGFRIEEAR
ncbi:MAG: hypothetical protein D6812_02400, partial [Deltaproteobacteria bacterium]